MPMKHQEPSEICGNLRKEQLQVYDDTSVTCLSRGKPAETWNDKLHSILESVGEVGVCLLPSGANQVLRD